jgi:hypothetical protein
MGLSLVCDGRLHWDEPSYLYAAAYQDVAQILAGDVQPSGIADFIQGRILHVLLLKALLSPVGAGMIGFAVVVAVHLGLLIGFIVTARLILRELLPEVPTRNAALILLVLSPVVLYFVGKTMADNESLAAAAVATLALLRCAQRRNPAVWCSVAAVAMAAALLIKNQMVLMPAAFWAAGCLVPVAGIARRRLAWTGIAAGIASILLAFLFLQGLGIDPRRYLNSYVVVLTLHTPLAAQLLSIATLYGVLWVLVPIAAISSRRRLFFFLLLWAVLSVGPIVVITRDYAARHLAMSLIATGGLIALALESLGGRVIAWHRFSNVAKSAVATAAVLVLMAGNAIALAVSPFEVEIRQMRTALDLLDSRYGSGQYVVLTSWAYTDFHVLRFLWPEVDVHTVGSQNTWTRGGGHSRRVQLESWYKGRNVDSIDDLERLQRPLIYFGYRHTFPVENLTGMLRNALGEDVTRGVLAQIDPIDHLSNNWLCNYPDARFDEIAQIGHYRVYRLTFGPTGAAPEGCP